MALSPLERTELEERIMRADLSQKEATTKLADRQFRWETFRALATILASVAVTAGAMIAVGNYMHPAQNQPVLPPGTVITIPAR